jgi:predicted glycosyltransferase
MPNESKQVMIYVQHLLGIGHLRRVWFLACALAKQRIKVDLVSGGMPIDGLDQAGVTIHQLPAVRSNDSSFNQLVDEYDQPIDDAWKKHRRDQLLNLLEQLNPRLLITETFPFGRRMMRFELIPLLQAARQSARAPLIVSSIRDILQPKSKPGRNQEVLEWVETYYDKILIHGDPQIATLDLTFPLAGGFSHKLNYTGYIVNSADDECDAEDGYNEVIVSGGGGAASLGRCTVSISQAGYNTVMDILRQKTPAVLVPFAEAGELEQSIRAQQLQKRNRAVCIEENHLSPLLLAEAVDKAARLEVESFDIDMNGAGNSAALIAGWLHE